MLVLAISCHATLHKYCLLLLNHGRGIEGIHYVLLVMFARFHLGLERGEGLDVDDGGGLLLLFIRRLHHGEPPNLQRDRGGNIVEVDETVQCTLNARHGSGVAPIFNCQGRRSMNLIVRKRKRNICRNRF